MKLRPLTTAARRLRPHRAPSHPYHLSPSSCRHSSRTTFGQAHPLGGFYESLISQPLPQVQSATRQSTIPSPPETLPKTTKEETLAKARVVFGSRLVGPAESRSELDQKSALIAGVKVPPKPEEPDNCCMSGCVNCVWDQYGEEVEQWAAKRKEADIALSKQSKTEVNDDIGNGAIVGSMDDDGDGSETNWGTGLETDLLGCIPVGIREFMKSEKRLREKHAKQGTLRG